MEDFDISVEVQGAPGHRTFAAKLAGPLVEINVVLPEGAADLLERGLSARWVEGAAAVGTCAGLPVFWSAGEPGLATILIGADDQSWDIGLSVSAAIVEELARQLREGAGGA